MTDLQGAVSTAILVGGRARRMGGHPKGLMTKDGQAIIHRLAQLCTDGPIFLVGDPDGPYGDCGFTIRPDLIPNRGAPGGILTALSVAKSPWVRILACDLPNLTVEAIQGLTPMGDEDVVLYRVAEQPQYLIGLWRRSCLPILQARLHESAPGFARILDSLSVRWLQSTDEATFQNMNNADDAKAAGVHVP